MSLTWRARTIDVPRAEALRNDYTGAAALVEDAPKEELLNLKKLWYGLKWVLDRSEDVPAGVADAIMGGDELGVNINKGHPVKVIDADAVRDLAALLRHVKPDDVRVGFVIREMLEENVYPPIWADPGALEEKLVPAFQKLKKFYLRAAEKGCAVLVVIG